MLKLSLKPGEYITLGDNIKIVFSGGSANNIHLLVDAPREVNIARSTAGRGKNPSPYYKEQGISKTAQREIAEILMREKRNQSHVSEEETVTRARHPASHNTDTESAPRTRRYYTTSR